MKTPIVLLLCGLLLTGCVVPPATTAVTQATTPATANAGQDLANAVTIDAHNRVTSVMAEHASRSAPSARAGT